MPRNVLVFVADDMGFELGIYNNSVIHTPNIDSIAARGMTFTQAFCSVSSCSPSRSTILTGLPQHQNGMFGLHHEPNNFNSMINVQSLSSILRQHNIKTGIIGKKHVGPSSVYPFDFAHTEETEPLIQVGRNISRMRDLAREFFTQTSGPFLLYIGFHDPHRCSVSQRYGGFCEHFGSGEPDMGVIPDWKPHWYDKSDVIVPYYIPDNDVSRQDLANQYTVINRMDQGVGLILKELTSSGFLDNTLILFTSDNGIPFPGAKTNLYTPGMGEPMIISHPNHKDSWGKENADPVSLLDIVPTILDWFRIPYPDYRILPETPPVQLTGRSMLQFLRGQSSPRQAVFGSHNFHEVTMNYPMRSIRTLDYQLIHNINNKMPYPIAEDLASSPTYQAMMKNQSQHLPLHWYKSLRQYYYRDAWELFDLRSDPEQLINLADDPGHTNILKSLKIDLYVWLNTTSDVWYCTPGGVLDTDAYQARDVQLHCLDMHDGFPLP